MTTLAMASTKDARLPYEVADDDLRVVMLTMMAWAWARIDVAAATTTGQASEACWSMPAAAFRQHILPEFDMRLSMVKRACGAALLAQNVSA